MRRQVQFNPDVKCAVFIRGVREGYPRPRELFKALQKEIERQNAEIREREEKRKRMTDEFRERERRYSEKMRNGTPEEQERERVFQQEKKRNGGWVTDIMERRRWGLAGPFEGN